MSSSFIYEAVARHRGRRLGVLAGFSGSRRVGIFVVFGMFVIGM